jgi:hypothetical protein
MEQAILVIGIIVILIACIVVLTACWAGALSALRKYHERRDEMVRSRAVRDMGRMLSSDAYWFGEHAPTQRALQLIGASLVRDGSFDTSVLRENWRKSEKAEA